MAKEKDFRHIVRIADTDIDGRKTLLSGLKSIKGVDFSLANAICVRAEVDKNKTAGHMAQEEIHKLNQILKDPASYNIPDYLLNRRKDYETGRDLHLIGMDLDFAQKDDVKRMQKIKSYRGMRLAWGLPVRGQRTRSNFRKNKGRVVGVKRKKGSKSGRV